MTYLVQRPALIENGWSKQLEEEEEEEEEERKKERKKERRKKERRRRRRRKKKERRRRRKKEEERRRRRGWLFVGNKYWKLEKELENGIGKWELIILSKFTYLLIEQLRLILHVVSQSFFYYTYTFTYIHIDIRSYTTTWNQSRPSN